jgi:hypothetical protein
MAAAAIARMSEIFIGLPPEAKPGSDGASFLKLDNPVRAVNPNICLDTNAGLRVTHA